MNKEIQSTLEWLEECGNNDWLFETGDSRALLDYITNLQNQLEEKTYLYNKLDIESKYVTTNLQEENEELKNRVHDLLIDNTEYKLENERLNLELSGYRKAILNDDKLLGLKSRIDKALHLMNHVEEYDYRLFIERLENILNGEE